MSKPKDQSQQDKLGKRFRRIETLGGGGNGTVYYAYDQKTSQKVAVKQLRRMDNERVHRFVAEIRVVEQFSKSIAGIIPIIESAPEEYWYAMPVAKTIQNHIEETNPTAEDIVLGVIQLAETLSQLHEEGISHRDIKPANILFYKGRYCLSDFGLVSLPDDPDHFTRSDRGLGAIFTIAPEMKRDPKHADGKRADVFSLAKTLWMLLTGDDKGFDGVYNPFDRSHSLRYIDKLKDEHLVELETLLTASTDNNPALRPDMTAFRNGLADWLEIKRDPDRVQASEWNFINKYLFGENMPESVVWSDRDTIIRILNAVGTLRAFNHMLFPDGGGLDFWLSEPAAEAGCICIFDTLRFAHIVRPAQLHFETFGTDQVWSYFFLELSSLEPALADGMTSEYHEILEEDTPGHYVSSRDSVYGVYDYDTGTPLPKGHRSVIRYLKGSILIVLKGSPYNGIPQTYDGRHSQCSSGEFRTYIELLREAYNKFIALGYSENRILYAIGRNPFNERAEAAPEPKALQKSPKNFIKSSFSSWSFRELLKPPGKGNIAFSFSFQIQNGGTLNEILKNEGFYICVDGSIQKTSSEETIYCLYDRDEALRLKAQCDERICTLCESAGFDRPDLRESYFKIQLKRSGKPSHLFTKEEIKSLMRSADDRQQNVLVIDENGYAKLVQDTSLGFLYPVRHEAWQPRNNYVGKYSSLSTLDESYLGSLQGWLSYLQSGRRIFVDHIEPNTNIRLLIDQISKFY